MDDTLESNHKKIVRIRQSIIAVVTVASLLIGFILSVPLPLGILGLAGSYFLMRSISRNANRAVLSQLVTSPASEIEHARIFNVIDGLCVVSGDHRPTIEIVTSPFPIALAVGNASEATVVVSNGFCNTMDRVETEAVFAQLLSRIRTGDCEITAFVMSLIATFSKFGLGSVARSLAIRTLNPDAVLWADIAACQATRYPPGLVSALEKVASAGETSVGAGVYPLWFASPVVQADSTITTTGFSSMGFSSTSIVERIGVLKEI